MKTLKTNEEVRTRFLWPGVGVLTAIAITSVMDARGLGNFSAFPLAPLLAVLWYVQRFSRQEVGFTLGEWRFAAMAVLYPLLVMLALGVIAAVVRDVDLSHTNVKKALLNLALTTTATIVIAIVTEEGFFRGWLWASLERAGLSAIEIVIWTSVAFSLWHWSAAFLDRDFAPPRPQALILLANAAVIGAVWGLLRWRSGSIIVTSVSHGVWNGLAYVLFGFGTHTGALGVKHTLFIAPEIGLLGLTLNLGCVAMLWIWSSSGRQRVPKLAT